jgi:hypothetical protein
MTGRRGLPIPMETERECVDARTFLPICPRPHARCRFSVACAPTRLKDSDILKTFPVNSVLEVRVAKNEKPVSNKPSKMTVMLFQLEGNDETLQEGFRTINNAIDKLANPVVRVIGPSPTLKGLPLSKTGDDNTSGLIDAEAVEETDEAEETPDERLKPPRTAPRQPKVLELDLKAGTVPLREYLEQRHPTTDTRRSLLIAAWMKANLSLDEVTIDHIYTAYRHMGWASQKDVGSPLRSMKAHGWFAKGKDKGAYAINHIGIDVAERNEGE